jgi:hypothetical protein
MKGAFQAEFVLDFDSFGGIRFVQYSGVAGGVVNWAATSSFCC